MLYYLFSDSFSLGLIRVKCLHCSQNLEATLNTISIFISFLTLLPLYSQILHTTQIQQKLRFMKKTN